MIKSGDPSGSRMEIMAHADALAQNKAVEHNL
jgi:hypothetical protein